MTGFLSVRGKVASWHGRVLWSGGTKTCGRCFDKLSMTDGRARRQSAVATVRWQTGCAGGRIATGNTTWSLPHTTGDYQTNPILFKPAWKFVPDKAKNEANLGISVEGAAGEILNSPNEANCFRLLNIWIILMGRWLGVRAERFFNWLRLSKIGFVWGYSHPDFTSGRAVWGPWTAN